MSGGLFFLFFLCACIGIGIVQYWLVQNDRLGPTDRTKGLLAMREADPAAASGIEAPRRRGMPRQRVPQTRPRRG